MTSRTGPLNMLGRTLVGGAVALAGASCGASIDVPVAEGCDATAIIVGTERHACECPCEMEVTVPVHVEGDTLERATARFEIVHADADHETIVCSWDSRWNQLTELARERLDPEAKPIPGSTGTELVTVVYDEDGLRFDAEDGKNAVCAPEE